MISIIVCNVPVFLRRGFFYESLDTLEQNSLIEVPESCYVENDEVNNLTDLAKRIKVVAFWELYSIPLTIIVFCERTDSSIWKDVLLEHEDLDFARSLVCIFESTTPLVNAIEHCCTEVVQYLAPKNVNDTSPAAKAAELGRVDYLTILHKYGHPWDKSVCEKAAANGNLDCLIYLHENGCP